MKISDMVNSFKNLESNPEEEMKSYILSLARELNLDEGHVLPVRVLLHRAIKFNPKQRDALEPALNSLITEGYFEEKDGKAFLTAQGKNALY
jgi:hypothetical protein